MRLYHSYDKGKLLSEEQYIRHLTKKWLQEVGISIERLREIAPSIDVGEKGVLGE